MIYNYYYRENYNNSLWCILFHDISVVWIWNRFSLSLWELASNMAFSLSFSMNSKSRFTWWLLVITCNKWNGFYINQSAYWSCCCFSLRKYFSGMNANKHLRQIPQPLSNPDEYSYEQMWIGRWPSKPHCRWGDIHDALSYVRSSSSSFYMLFVSSIPSGTFCSRRFRITVATGFQNNHLCSPVRHISWNNHRLRGLLHFC